MGVIKLEIRCPQKVNSITADPNPDWSFNSLLLELNSLEKKLNDSSQVIKTQFRDSSRRKNTGRCSKAVVVRVSDDELEDSEEDLGHGTMVANRFNCDAIYLSESNDSDCELSLDDQSYLMDKAGTMESALFELSQEQQVGVKEKIRIKISELEMELMRESEKSDSAFRRVEKYREARKESERRFDTQYQRKIAEALDNHLTAIQRDHELKSQIEERRLRSDAAYEEAKRKEKALVPQGTVVKAAQSALILEQGRLEKLKKLDVENQSYEGRFSKYASHISRLIRLLKGIKDSVRAKSTELVDILKNPSCPQSISIAAFVKEIVKACEIDKAAGYRDFACGYVTVLVTAQVPHVMEILLAEFHKVCMYTVPKHIAYSESAFQSEEAYYKTLGYQDRDGKLESTDDYLTRLKSYMKIYAALIQTEIQDVPNLHGAKEGWAWLARFLNTLPANKYTACALNTFLQTAGFFLYKRYKSQFRKMLNIVSEEFLKPLREQEDTKLLAKEIKEYIEAEKYFHEPEGRNLQTSMLSNKAFMPKNE